MKKTISILMSLIMGATLLSSCTTKKDETMKYKNKHLKKNVVVKVGDETVSLEEVRFNIAQYVDNIYREANMSDKTDAEKQKFWETDGKEYKQKIYDGVVDSVVSLTAMSAKAKKGGYSITDEELKKQYEDNKLVEPKEQLKKQYSLTDEGIDEYMRKQLTYQKYAEKELDKDKRLNPGEDELKKYFKDNYIKAQHILKLTTNEQTNQPVAPEEKAKIKTATEEILARVKGGEDFKAVMDVESEDPGSKSQPEGYVFTEGEMVEEFYQGAKALKDGDISGIVETSYGFHIIKRLPLDLDKDYAAVSSKVGSAYKSKNFQKVIDDTKAEFKISVDYKKLKALDLVNDFKSQAPQNDSSTGKPQDEKTPATKPTEKK